MPHVNQLVEKYGKKGFVAVGVTDEPEAPTNKFVEETKMTAIIAYEPGLPSMKAYGFGGFPSSALVAPDGKLVWSGHPSGLTEKIIEEHLAGVKLSSGESAPSVDASLPKKLAAVQKQLEGGKLGAARVALEKAAKEKWSDDDRKLIETALADVDALSSSMITEAEAAKAEGRLFDAEGVLKKVAVHFEGSAAASDAKNALAELAKTENFKAEIDAGQRIAKAQKLAEDGKAKDAASMLKSVIDGPLKTTREAERARTLLESIGKTSAK